LTKQKIQLHIYIGAIEKPDPTENPLAKKEVYYVGKIITEEL
jgi:hypothetical protein